MREKSQEPREREGQVRRATNFVLKTQPVRCTWLVSLFPPPVSWLPLHWLNPAGSWRALGHVDETQGSQISRVRAEWRKGKSDEQKTSSTEGKGVKRQFRQKETLQAYLATWGRLNLTSSDSQVRLTETIPSAIVLWSLDQVLVLSLGYKME